MKWIVAAALAAIVTTDAAAQQADKPTVATPEYSRAFCDGWNEARAVEAKRIASWRNGMLLAMSPPEAANTPQGAAVRLVIDSVATYIALPPIPGKVVTESKVEIECPPPAVAAPEPKP